MPTLHAEHRQPSFWGSVHLRFVAEKQNEVGKKSPKLHDTL